MPTSLVIVDMQQNFPAANEPSAILGAAKEIERAKKRKAGIVFLEFQNLDPTHEVYRKLLKDYPYLVRTRKSEMDGSEQVLRALRRKKFDVDRIRVCGVNSCHCVRATVDGLLLRSDAKIEVSTKACACDCQHQACWRNYRHDRLTLLFK